MIPKDRAVIGADIDTLRELLGIDTLTLCYILAIPPQKLSDYTSEKNKREMISNPVHALLVRYYDKYPHRAPVDKYPTPQDLIELGLTPREVGPLLGRDISRGNSWKRGSKTSAQIDRMVYHLYHEIIPQGEYDEWLEVVKREGALRGNPDIMSDGKWGGNSKD